MRQVLIGFLLLSSWSCQNAQVPDQEDRKVGGPCEGCEALFEYTGTLNSVDTIPGFENFSPQLLVTGTVFRSDGRTPANDVVVYLYQTDTTGLYRPGPDARGWESRHGRHRGWIRTGADGAFSFYTFEPAPYPGRQEPRHIHLTVKEPRTVPYYVESIHFIGDPLLKSEPADYAPRGGSGRCQEIMRDGRLMVRRDIILGRNVPGY